jgi:hypothetical protein
MPRDAKYLLSSVSLALVSMLFASTVFAQSALDRLERQIRQRNPQSTNDNSEADRTSPAASPTMNATIGNLNREPAYLGLVADDQNDRGRGVRVLSVHPGSPADKAGIHVQDLITSMTGIRIRQMSDLSDILETFSPGQTTSLEVLRDDKRQTLKLVFGRRPANGKPQTSTPSDAGSRPNAKSGTGDASSVVIPSPPPELIPEPPEQPGPLLITPQTSQAATKSQTPSALSLPETMEQPADTTLDAAKPRTSLQTPQATPPAATTQSYTSQKPSQTSASSQEVSQRVDQLQHRVEELERRIAELEQALAEAKKAR